MLFSAMYTGLVLPLELHMFVGGCTHSGSEGWDPVACLCVYSQWVYSVMVEDGVSGCTVVVEDGVSGCTQWWMWSAGVLRLVEEGSVGVLTVVEVSDCTHSGGGG